MLEIIFVYFLGTKIAAKCKELGRSAVPWVLMLVFLWIGGEIAGAIVGVIGSAVATGGEEPNFAFVYIGAIAGALVGAGITFAVVFNLPPATPADDFGPSRRVRRELVDEDEDRPEIERR